MSNLTKIEETIYNEVFKVTNAFVLNEKQKETLTKEIKELNLITTRYIEILETAKCNNFLFMDGFSSDECKQVIKEFKKDISKIQRKNKDYGEILSCKYLLELLGELENNNNLLIDRLKLIVQEENSLLENLKSDESSKNIQKLLFFIGHHIGDLPYLVSINQDYFIKRDCPAFFKYISVIAEAIEDTSKKITGMYFKWVLRGC